MAETFSTSIFTGVVDATSTFYIGHGQNAEYKLEAITLYPNAATTEDGSNKFVIAFTQGSDTVATSYDTSTGGNALVAGTARGMTMTATAGDALEFGSSDSLKIVATETGNKTMSAQIVATWSKVRV